ncbi:MAG: hypothetical protein IT438_15095 [Phycisphaerales bacterium]|nr:hypothetical protein [Phycisphaerales bacterium]
MPTRSHYSLHPGIAETQKWIGELKDRTGRSLDEWFAFIKKQSPDPRDEKTTREWLKAEHKQGTMTAWWLAEKAVRGPSSLDEDSPGGYLKTASRWIEDQYAGKKAPLRPLYDTLLKLGLAIGKDVKACPCKTIMPFYRERVFAQVKPSTNTRIDLGLALAMFTPESKIPKRIIDTGGREKKDRITHRIPIEKPGDIDDFVERWLRIAYDLDAPKPVKK